MSFYLAEKYPVIQGNSASSSALITCWTDPNALIAANPNVLDRVAVMGTLYSKEGVSLIIRNLLLHPGIRVLYIYDASPLSQTSFGKAGADLLRSVWRGECAEHETPYGKIHQEIAIESIKELITSVEIREMGNIPLSEVSNHIDTSVVPPWTDMPRDFPESKRDESLPFPAESQGFVVHGKGILDTWTQAIARIMRYGNVKETQYGNKQKECMGVSWVIEHHELSPQIPEDWPEALIKTVGIDAESLEGYKDALLDPVLPEGTAYTYGSRMNDFSGHNQVQNIIDQLRSHLYTRRAFASVYDPTKDPKGANPPCLSLIQCLVSPDKKLHMMAVFRSHDMFKGAMPNAVALMHLQKYIAAEVGLELGSMMITSLSAHIYEEEWSEAQKMVDCMVYNRSNYRFNELLDMDPRGLVRIRIDGDVIVCTLSSLSGEQLFETSASSARRIMHELARQSVLQRFDHFGDIVIELVKAESAIQSGQSYTQDRPFIYESIRIG